MGFRYLFDNLLKTQVTTEAKQISAMKKVSAILLLVLLTLQNCLALPTRCSWELPAWACMTKRAEQFSMSQGRELNDASNLKERMDEELMRIRMEQGTLS